MCRGSRGCERIERYRVGQQREGEGDKKDWEGEKSKKDDNPIEDRELSPTWGSNPQP